MPEHRTRGADATPLAGLACLLCTWAAIASPAWADEPNPLRFVPAQADVCLQVPQPGRALAAFTTFNWFRQWGQLDGVVELLDSTNSRRARQFVAYFEKQLGLPWRDALDRLAGGGVAAALKFGSDPAPALLVVQGTDAELVQRFVSIGRQIIEQELARLDSKDRPCDESYRGIATMSIGKQFHAAVVGATLLLSNNGHALHKALDLHFDGPGGSLLAASGIAEARRLLPPDPLASIWLNLDPARRSDAGQQFFKLPPSDPQFTIFNVFVGGWINVVGRSPFACAGLYREKSGFKVTVRMPRGREGLPAVLSGHVPPAGQPGALPPLQPPGVLYSQSAYFDPSKFWEHRGQLFNPQNLKSVEEFDKNSGRFLAGHRFSQLLTELGARVRFVVANQHHTGYSVQSHQRIPAFAGVFEMRRPEEFSQAMNGVLRGAALLAGFQTKLKLVEEKRGGILITGYRFPEDAQLKGDDNYLRYNYSPSFATVRNQFVVSSTLELCRDLVDSLVKEQGETLQQNDRLKQAQATLDQAESQLQLTIAKLSTAADVTERSQLIARVQQLEGERAARAKDVDALKQRTAKGVQALPVAVRSQIYAVGGAEALGFLEDRLLAQTILNQALPPEAARRQVKLFIDLVRQIGMLRTETDYKADDFRFEVRWVQSGK